jgi:hypothetical protein
MDMPGEPIEPVDEPEADATIGLPPPPQPAEDLPDRP